GGEAPAEPPASGLWPLYAASLVVCLCGLGAVSVTLSDTPWTQTCAGLLIFGHLTSFYLRRRGVRASSAYPVLASGMALLVAYEVVLPQPHLGISTSLSELQPDVGLGVMITWLVVIHSFGMVTNGALLFNSVPALATMGLIGSTNLNAEVPILFGLFL